MAIRTLAKNAVRSGSRRRTAISRAAPGMRCETIQARMIHGATQRDFDFQVRNQHTRPAATPVDFLEEGMDTEEELEAEREIAAGGDGVSTPGRSHIDRVVWCVDLCESAVELSFSLNALKQTGIKLVPYDLPAIFKRLRTPSKALAFYKWVKEEDTSLTLANEAYENILKTLCDRKHYGTVWRLLEEMIRSRPGVPDFIFMTIFKSCAAAKRSAEAAHFFNRMSDFGCKPSEDLYNCLIEALLHCSAEKAAVAYIERMEKARFRVSDRNKELLRLVQRKSEVHRIYEAILAGDVEAKEEIFCDTIIKLCQVYKLDEAFKLFRFMTLSKKLHPTAEVYETLTNYLAETERTERAFTVFKILVALKDRPTFFTCIWVTSSLIMDLRIKDASLIVRALKGSRYQHSVADYNRRLSRATLMKATWDLLRFMKYSGYQPNRGTYLACVRAAHKRLKGRLDIQEVIRAGGNPMLLPCNLLLKILVKSDNRYAWQLVKFMEEKKLSPNAYSYSRLIKTYYKTEKLDLMWQAYEALRKRNLYPCNWAYPGLVHAAAWTISADYALDLFEEMLDKRGLPRPRMCKYLIVWLCYRGCSDAALNVYKALKARGAVLRPSLRMFRCLRNVQTSSTRELLAEIEEDTIHKWQVADGLIES